MTASDPAELALLLSILQELPNGVWVARAPNGELAYANRMFGEIMGMAARDDVRAGEYAQSYLICDRTGRLYPEHKLPYVQALQQRRAVVVDDLVIARADGSRVYVRAVGKPLFDAAGEVSHVMVAFSDITAEVKAHTDGEAIREKLASAMQHAPIILFATDADGMITLSEGAGLKGMGYQSGDLVGQSVFEVYKDNPQVVSNSRRVLRGESFTTVVDLGSVALESWLSPAFDENGAVSGMIGVCTDVTERLRLQRQVEQADRLAALGRLAASVAHEINNPLAYVVEALQLAGEVLGEVEGPMGAGGPAASPLGRLRRLIGEAADGAERVRLITRDLKAFSRHDEDVRRPLDINHALTSAIKLVAKRIEMRTRIDLRLGPVAIVRADENRLVQIFVNLILNAADALSSAAADRNRIRISTRREPGEVVVEVADNGPGVPEEMRTRIFDAFVTTKPVGEGTGLGLFVTRNIVAALGGSVEVGQAPEGGALFSVRLPTEALAAAPVSPPAPTAAQQPGAASRRWRVLIIDDEPQVAHLLRLSLERDCDAQSFTSARGALDHLLSGATYDLIFCDLMMAELSGMKLYDELRRRAPGREQALVFMTGGVFDPQVSTFLSTIPNDCVDKPFDIRAEVLRRIAAAGGR